MVQISMELFLPEENPSQMVAAHQEEYAKLPSSQTEQGVFFIHPLTLGFSVKPFARPAI